MFYHDKKLRHAVPVGEQPVLRPPDPQGHAQQQQMTGSIDKGGYNGNIKDTILP